MFPNADTLTISIGKSSQVRNIKYAPQYCRKESQIITSGESNLTQGRIAAADGRFNRIRQTASTCPPMMAHWRHLANTIEVVLPLAHLSLLPERQIDRLSHFCTVYVRVSSGMLGMPFPSSLGSPLPMGGSVPPSNTWFLQPLDSTFQMASRSVQPFLHSSQQKALYFTMGGDAACCQVRPLVIIIFAPAFS